MFTCSVEKSLTFLYWYFYFSSSNFRYKLLSWSLYVFIQIGNSALPLEAILGPLWTEWLQAYPAMWPSALGLVLCCSPDLSVLLATKCVLAKASDVIASLKTHFCVQTMWVKPPGAALLLKTKRNLQITPFLSCRKELMLKADVICWVVSHVHALRRLSLHSAERFSWLHVTQI